uniref:Ig-like domain-containing protein n=1 Tax=Lates calcarifer TaxID=8187 RepID=A0A4W6DUH2_LATCA
MGLTSAELLICLSPSGCLRIQPKIIGVTEGSDVTLPCSLSSRESIELKRFEWRKDGQKDVFLFDGGSRFTSGQDPQFKGRVSHFKDELKNGNASITIRDTKLTDRSLPPLVDNI